MRVRIAGASLAVLALVPVTAWIMAWPIEKAVYLAPVIVVGAAAIVGLAILWSRVAWEQIKESKRPRLVVGLWVAGIGLVVLLTVLGVNLPREGH
jgi:hypothetical protein